MNTQTTDDKKRILKGMLSGEGFHLQNESEWDTLLEHIEVHKYFVNQNINWTISWDDALFSWHENVFAPIKQVLSNRQVRNAFPGKSPGSFSSVFPHIGILSSRRTPMFPTWMRRTTISRNTEKVLSKLFAFFSLQSAA